MAQIANLLANLRINFRHTRKSLQLGLNEIAIKAIFQKQIGH